MTVKGLRVCCSLDPGTNPGRFHIIQVPETAIILYE
jgi:hypothetical protein